MEPTVQTPSEPPKPLQYKTSFHGDGLGLALIVLKNLLLTVVTLGIYSFWGKVNIRRYLWSSTEFSGQRLAFHGTGKELLMGFVKVVGVLVVTQGAGHLLGMVNPTAGVVARLAMVPVFIVLIPYAVYQSQRYVYSRTSWRGIRFGMAADPWPFVKTFVGGYLLTIITLGIYGVIWQNKLYRIRTDNSRVGTMALRYTGDDKEVFSMFLKALPWIILSLGIHLIWFQTKISRYRAGHTWIGSATIGAARGYLQLEGGEYFGLILMNFFALVLTLGLATPWIIAHNMSFFLKRFSFVGNVDFDRIEKVASSGSAAADDLASALHVGIGI